MIAAAVAPTTSVMTRMSTCVIRLTFRMPPNPVLFTLCMVALKGLPDAEMKADAARLGCAVHEEAGNRIELVADIKTNRTDRRLIAQSRSDRVAQIAQVESERVRPHVAGVEEQHPAQIAAQHRAQLFADRQQAVAADRQAVDERADLESPPPANARRAAEKIPLPERHVLGVVADRPQACYLHAAGEHELVADRKVMAAVSRGRVVVERPRHEASGFLGMKCDLVSAVRVQEVVRR